MAAAIIPLIFSPTQSLHLTNNKNANIVVPSKKLIMPKRLISKMYEEIGHGIRENSAEGNRRYAFPAFVVNLKSCQL